MLTQKKFTKIINRATKGVKNLIFNSTRNSNLEWTLGAALASKAQVLDDFIASNLLTQVHGDCKGWNLFFIKKSEEISAAEKSPVLFIDMQWTGVGHPLQVYIFIYLLVFRLRSPCMQPLGGQPQLCTVIWIVEYVVSKKGFQTSLNIYLYVICSC